MPARLPVVASDNNTWGTVLNQFLSVAHNSDGSLKNLYVSAKDPTYGAVGDGVADDTAALQAMLNAGGGFLPPGTYKITSQLLITVTGTSLIGASLGSVFLQPTSPISGNLIAITGANDVTLRSFSIKGASSTYSSNPAVNAIQVNHSNGFRAIDLNVLYNNGPALQINSDATGDSYFPYIVNFHALSCGSGIQLIGTNSVTGRNMGAFLVNVVCDQTQNGDSIQILDVHDVTIVNLEGSNFSSGNVLHIKGVSAAIFVDNADIGALTGGGAAVPGATVLIESGGLGSPKQIAFTGGIFENGLTGITITAGTQITLNQVEIIKNGTHGIAISGTADLVSIQQCIFDLNGFTAGAGHYDINDSSTGKVAVSNNIFNTPGGTGVSQVASACNFTAGTSYCFANQFNAATPFTGFPTIARSNPGYNPVGLITPPAVPASTVATSAVSSDMTVYIKGGTLTAITVSGGATGISAAASAGAVHTVRVPAGQTLAVTYTVAPTWTWFGD